MSNLYYVFVYTLTLNTLPSAAMPPPDPLVYLFPQLDGINTDSSSTKLTIVGISFLIHSAIFVATYFASYQFVTFRKYLRQKEKVFWCLAIIRALFGILSMFFGIWYLAFDDSFYDDVVNTLTVTSFMGLHIAIGFFVFENVALYTSAVVFQSFDKFLAIHHTLSLIGGSIVAYYGKGHYFGMVGLLLEMTTPFSCICWLLLKAKMAHLFVWKLNQLVLVHLFHCRTTVEGYIFLKTYFQWDNIWNNLPLPIFILLYTQLFLQFFMLTPYWTYKKMMQLFNPVDWNHPELDDKQIVQNGDVKMSTLKHAKQQ